MTKGKGRYGSKRGRPPKKSKSVKKSMSKKPRKLKGY